MLKHNVDSRIRRLHSRLGLLGSIHLLKHMTVNRLTNLLRDCVKRNPRWNFKRGRYDFTVCIYSRVGTTRPHIVILKEIEHIDGITVIYPVKYRGIDAGNEHEVTDKHDIEFMSYIGHWSASIDLTKEDIKKVYPKP